MSNSKARGEHFAGQDYGHYAAIGDDGTRPVVWGVGATPFQAQRDASLWLEDAEKEMSLSVVRISAERFEKIVAGDVSADDLVTV